MIGICGASGFIGWELYNFIAEKEEEVLGTYCHNYKDGLQKFDLRNDYLNMFDSCDYVVILSAHAKIQFCEQNRIEAFYLNVLKTKHLLDHLNKKGIPALFVSSDAAEKMRDTTYGKYKRMIEKYIKDNKLNADYIRPGKINEDNIKELCEQIWARIGRKD